MVYTYNRVIYDLHGIWEINNLCSFTKRQTHKNIFTQKYLFAQYLRIHTLGHKRI